MYRAEGEHHSYAKNYVTWHAWIEKTKKCWQHELPSRRKLQTDNTVVNWWLTGNMHSVCQHSWAKERKNVIRSPSLVADDTNLWKWYCLIPLKIMFKRSGRQFAMLSGMVFWRNLITRNAQIIVILKTKHNHNVVYFPGGFNVSQRHFFHPQTAAF